MEMTFDIGERASILSQRLAELIAENLRRFATGPSHRFYRDVEMLSRAWGRSRMGHGCAAITNAMEDTLVGRREGPIPLDPGGKDTYALMQALSSAGPASWEARSEYPRLLNMLREAQTA